MAPQTILVRKGIQTKHMTTLAWSLLPADKNGWTPVENEVGTVTNEVVISKGKKSAKVVETGTVTNEVEEPKEQVVDDETLATTQVNENQIVIDPTEEKEKFVQEVSDAKITKTQLKDYLDLKEVSYEQNDSKTVLIDKLADVLCNDIEKLKIEFSL